MYRGTTATLRLKIKGGLGAEPDNMWVTIKQSSVKLTKSLGELTVGDGEVLVPLTQRDTLKFSAGTAEIQMRVLMKDGRALASTVKSVTFNKILKGGVIGPELSSVVEDPDTPTEEPPEEPTEEPAEGSAEGGSDADGD